MRAFIVALVVAGMASYTALYPLGGAYASDGEGASEEQPVGEALPSVSAQEAPQARAAAAFASGSGTQADPYIISTPEQMASFRDSVNSGEAYAGQYIALGSDIDLSAYNWTPIGQGTRSGTGVTADSTPFCGSFDGAGHTISGLTLTADASASGDYAIGLFGVLKGATVRNVNIANAAVSAPNSELAGILSGLMIDGSVVSGVNVSGSLAAKCAAGGIAGRMILTGTIENCANSASVTTTGGSGNTGGIVGAAYYTTPAGTMDITGCTNSGAIEGRNDTGGIVGLCCAFVSGCTNTGKVDGYGYAVGGIAGEVKNYGGITSCTNTADVTTTEEGSDIYGTGGIVGWVRYNGTSGAYDASAVVPIKDNDNSGSVYGQNNAGGIVGVAYSAIDVTGNQNTAPQLQSSNFGAGIVGSIQKQDSALPSSVDAGVTVDNNVSTTPITNISAPNKDLYAYNNGAVPATITNEGTKWLATAAGQRYVSLQDAINSAPDGGVVKLAASATSVPKITVDRSGAVTLDLNGNDIAFLPEGEFLVTAGSFSITGSGSVSKPEDAQDQTLIEVSPKQGAAASAQVTGGSYSSDVSKFVPASFAELVKDQSSKIGKYVILPASDAKSQAKASVTSQGVTVYYENADEAARAAEADPDATVTVFGNSGQPTSDATPAKEVASLPQTDDDTYISIALLGFTISGSLFALGISLLVRSRSR